MKCLMGKTWILAGMAMLFWAGNSSGRDVREALEVLFRTQYCGTAMMDGMGLHTALRGESLLADNTYFNYPEEQWLPVLIDMTDEELETCLRDTAGDIADIRRVEAAGGFRDNSGSETSRFLWDAHKRVTSRSFTLVSMVVCLRNAEGGTAKVLDMLEKVGMAIPPEFSMDHDVNGAIVAKACRDGVFKRCIEVGRRYRAVHGPGSPKEWGLCRAFALYGIPTLPSDADRQEGYRYVLEFCDTVNNSNPGQWVDRSVAEFLPGWAGSLQRRHMAERCLASAETQDGETPAERIQRVCPWAAAELAADESELTDLREVYGDWNGEEDNGN